MKFVITGTGRSGTKFCATMLRNAGIYCGHEQVFATAMMPSHGPVRWGPFEGDSSLAAIPYLAEMTDVRKVLVVRHPMAYVASQLKAGSFLAGSQPAGLIEHLRQACPSVMNSRNEVEAALHYWLHCNSHCWDVDVVLKLETLYVVKLLRAIDIEPRWTTYPVGIINAAENYSMGEFTLDRVSPMLLDSVWDLAHHFGYPKETPCVT